MLADMLNNAMYPSTNIKLIFNYLLEAVLEWNVTFSTGKIDGMC